MIGRSIRVKDCKCRGLTKSLKTIVFKVYRVKGIESSGTHIRKFHLTKLTVSISFKLRTKILWTEVESRFEQTRNRGFIRWSDEYSLN